MNYVLLIASVNNFCRTRRYCENEQDSSSSGAASVAGVDDHDSSFPTKVSLNSSVVCLPSQIATPSKI